MNYPHLSPKAKEQLKHSDIERIEYIRSPRWIGYPQAQQVLVKLEDLLSGFEDYQNYFEWQDTPLVGEEV